MLSKLLLAVLLATLVLVAVSAHGPVCTLRVPCRYYRSHPRVRRQIADSVYGFSRDVRELLLVHFDKLTYGQSPQPCTGIVCLLLDLYCKWLEINDPELYKIICFGYVRR